MKKGFFVNVKWWVVTISGVEVCRKQIQSTHANNLLYRGIHEICIDEHTMNVPTLLLQNIDTNTFFVSN